MKLRFEVDQAACFRRGIDCPKSIVTIEVDPSTIEQKLRDLIADRLAGIDVAQLWNSDKGTEKMMTAEHAPIRIVADGPGFDDLVLAICQDESRAKERNKRHRNIAIAQAEAGLDLVGMAEAARKHQSKV